MKFVVILFLCIFVALANEASATESEQQSAKPTDLAGGHEAKGAKHSEFKHVKKSGKSKKRDMEKSRKGQVLKQIRKKMNAEGAGKKTKHHEEDGHKTANHRSGASAHGAKFHDASKRKKLNYKKGFREKYHKDEEKKHNSFFSNGHSSGEIEVFGAKHSNFNSKYSAKKQVEKHQAVEDQKDYKKSSKKVGGHDVSEKKGHSDQKSTKSHHNHQEKSAKKGGKKGGKQYKYKVPPHK